MQGYVAMRAMLERLASGNEVSRGWIDVRPEVVTSETVDAVTAREASLSGGTDETRAYYGEEIDALFENLDGSVQSFDALLAQ